MTNIIEHTYTALANTGELHLTEKDYSTNYLGKCKSYYAYLKSTGRQASTEVLLKLWTQLKKAEQEANANHTSKQFFFKKHQPSHLQKTAIPNIIFCYIIPKILQLIFVFFLNLTHLHS
jgi:hypothetical protein